MSPARYIHPVRLGAVPAEAGARLPVNTVLHGDCITRMGEMPDASVDMILTDPPYVCRYRDRSGRTVANDDNTAWIAPAAVQMHRVLKPDSFAVSFYGWSAADTFVRAWKAAGFQIVGHLVFVKNYSSGQRYLQYRHEMAYLLAKGRPPLPAAAKAVRDVLAFDYMGNRHHPTEKPVTALRPLIEALCPAGGLVLDPFCGSGSTLVAAQHAGRDYLGIEMDLGHVQTALRRTG